MLKLYLGWVLSCGSFKRLPGNVESGTKHARGHLCEIRGLFSIIVTEESLSLGTNLTPYFLAPQPPTPLPVVHPQADACYRILS
jgi:hypothetical protein